MDDLFAPFVRVWNDIASGLHAPFGFRLLMQPIVAAFFAVRAGRQDALEGKPLFFWAVLRDPVQRRERLREGWTHIGKLLIAAISIDVVYQVVVERWIYPFEAVMAGLILAVLPYLVFRGIVNRLLRARARAAE